MSKKRTETHYDSPSWAEFLESNVDSLILLESAFSEIHALLENKKHLLDIIYNGVVRGAKKKSLDFSQHQFSKKQGSLVEAAEGLEEDTEATLKSKFHEKFSKEREEFHKVYKTQKDKVRQQSKPTEDVPELILSYKVKSGSVFSSVVKKYLNDPQTPESKKKSIRSLSEMLDEIRAFSRASAGYSLSSISSLSEKIGWIMYEWIDFQPDIEASRDIDRSFTATAALSKSAQTISYLKKICKTALQKGTLVSLLPLDLRNLVKFATAGFYDGVKATKKIEKPRKSNAAKRHKEKLEKKEEKKIYGKYNPSIIEQLKHQSGWNEWKAAYNAVTKRYEKTDRRVDEGMDSLFSKSPFKARYQKDLEERQAIRESEIGKKALSYYDQIRAISKASTIWTQAQLYRASRYLGAQIKEQAESLTEKEAEAPPITQGKEFKEAQEGLKSASKSHGKKKKKHQHKKKARGRTR